MIHECENKAIIIIITTDSNGNKEYEDLTVEYDSKADLDRKLELIDQSFADEGFDMEIVSIGHAKIQRSL